MEVSVRTEGEFCIVTVKEDRIDAPVAVAFKETLRRVTADAPGRVVLDLGAVTFIDSSGLGAVVALLKVLNPQRQLALAGMTGPVARAFQLTRMDMVFSIYPTVEAAVDLAGA